MFNSRCRNIIGITTSDINLLKISVDAVARINQYFVLIICNYSHNSDISTRDIRRMGYHGRLHIINAHNVHDKLHARFEIISAARKIAIRANWILFCDAGDIVTNMDVPNVPENIFAIIQNAAVIARRVSDLVAAISKPRHVTIDGKNVLLARPNTAFCGTIVRAQTLFEMADIAHDILDKIGTVHGCADEIMWALVNKFAHRSNTSAMPMYMDDINYITIMLDRVKSNRTSHAHAVVQSATMAMDAALDGRQVNI